MAGHRIKHQFSELGGYVRDAGCRCFRWWTKRLHWHGWAGL